VNVSFVIWTTTPWTLPANLAVALHPEFNYEFLAVGEKEVYVIADALKETFLQTVGLPADVRSLGSAVGRDLENIQTRHPWVDRTSLVILGEHVTADTGTGVVHTAPGHGPEDFEIGKKYNLGVLSPVNERGVFTAEAGRFEGLRFDKANDIVVEYLKEINKLVHHSTFSHSYPHCWRCKKPLIYRATEQWFASVEGFRDQALKAIDTVEWLPASGRNRIFSMVENRTDWCISRQRAWGVPIPVFYCSKCGKHLMTAESIERVAAVFSEEGSDAWWEHEADHFLKGDFKCGECGGVDYAKETDIMDVWFDSGSSHSAVVDQRPELRGTPCEMYLEGSDQHRGWFQSSLLTSVATTGRAPYKTVLTHGFVVDENGRKMSKSAGNSVEPDEVIKQYGADVLRLWVASVNYTDDVPIGKNMLAQLAKVYEKLRNTARFILGNLHGFDPATDRVPLNELNEIDAYVLHRLHQLVTQVEQDFDRYEFFKYYQLLSNFCVVDLSSFYFDIAKDRLYTHGRKSKSRRAVQTVLEEVLQVLVRILVPVTPHLAEDIWKHIPETIKNASSKEESVVLTSFPSNTARFKNDKLDALWSDVIPVRNTVNKALEQARGSKKIGAPLEAQVVLSFDDDALATKVESLGADLAALFITSQAKVHRNAQSSGDHASSGRNGHEVFSEVSENGVRVLVSHADGDKCPRCWKFVSTIGEDKTFADLCAPCASAVSQH
jgi:isoleucyl-tRNA synthetase